MSSAGAEAVRRPGGFTLLELLVVLAIAALLVALVPPMFARALPGAQLRSSVHSLAASLQHTRDLAIRLRAAQRLELDLDGRIFAAPGGVPQRLPDGVRVELVTAASELTAGGRAGGVRYFPDGSSTGGRITLSNGSKSYHLDIDWLTGRVSLL